MNDPSESRDSPSRVSTLLSALIVLLVFLLPAAGFWWLRTTSQAVVENNLLAHTRDMVIRHLARTGGGWPRSWEDLAEDFEPADANYGTRSLDVLKARVELEFDVDLPALVAAPPDLNAPLRVIQLKGQAPSPVVDDLNVRLLEYLRTVIDARENGEAVGSDRAPDTNPIQK